MDDTLLANRNIAVESISLFTLRPLSYKLNPLFYNLSLLDFLQGKKQWCPGRFCGSISLHVVVAQINLFKSCWSK